MNSFQDRESVYPQLDPFKALFDDDTVMMDNFHDQIVMRSASVMYTNQKREHSFDSTVITNCTQSASSEFPSMQFTMKHEDTEKQLQATSYRLSIQNKKTNFQSLADDFPLSVLPYSHAIGQQSRTVKSRDMYSSSYTQSGPFVPIFDANKIPTTQQRCNLTERTSTFVDEKLYDPEATVRQRAESELTKSTAVDFTALDCKNEMTEINDLQEQIKHRKTQYRLDLDRWQMEEMQVRPQLLCILSLYRYVDCSKYNAN